jgi:hypothetical protein
MNLFVLDDDPVISVTLARRKLRDIYGYAGSMYNGLGAEDDKNRSFFSTYR